MLSPSQRGGVFQLQGGVLISAIRGGCPPLSTCDNVCPGRYARKFRFQSGKTTNCFQLPLTFRRVSEGLFTAKLSDLAINHAILELSRIPLDQTWTIWERISNASRSNA